MQKVKIDEEAIRISGSHSSKGNQLKWKLNNVWYKADCFGYEALAEIVVSEYLKHINLSEKEYVAYEPVKIEYKGKVYNGCRCDNFLSNQYSLIPVERVYQLYYAIGLAKRLGRIADVEERIHTAVDELEKVTGMSNFGVYLSKLIELDAFFLNEDRHTNNISLIYNPSGLMLRFSPSPYYDFGASLFSDTLGDYPIEEGKSMVETYEEYIKKIEAKPFARDFDIQLDAVQKLYGSHLKFDMTKETAIKLYSNLIKEKKLDEMYSKDVINRVEHILRMQIRKYSYMFC